MVTRRHHESTNKQRKPVPTSFAWLCGQHLHELPGGLRVRSHSDRSEDGASAAPAGGRLQCPHRHLSGRTPLLLHNAHRLLVPNVRMRGAEEEGKHGTGATVTPRTFTCPTRLGTTFSQRESWSEDLFKIIFY